MCVCMNVYMYLYRLRHTLEACVKVMSEILFLIKDTMEGCEGAVYACMYACVCMYVCVCMHVCMRVYAPISSEGYSRTLC